MNLRFWKALRPNMCESPEYICFDLIYSEYLSLEDHIKEDERTAIGKIEAKRKTDNLAWKDLYQFELILLDYFSREQLRSKIIRLRSDYRSIASEKEYADYESSKPPEVQSPPDLGNLKISTDEYNILLREDLKDLLSRIFLKYAILPVREKRIMDLSRVAAGLCLLALGLLLFILLVVFLVPLAGDLAYRGSKSWTQVFVESPTLSSLTIFVAVSAGALGGFVSALQRIQSQSNDGDSLYNLGLLFHSSNSVFIAPITGAIFATLLYLMFAASILQGTFFPKIYTPPGDRDRDLPKQPQLNTSMPVPTPVTSAANTKTNPSSAGNSANRAANSMNSLAGNTSVSIPIANADSAGPPVESAGKANSISEVPLKAEGAVITPTPTPAPAGRDTSGDASKGLNVFDFLARSGPASGKDYALLIIWCFIAGFAERFVPDALDRLIGTGRAGGR